MIGEQCIASRAREGWRERRNICPILLTVQNAVEGKSIFAVYSLHSTILPLNYYLSYRIVLDSSEQYELKNKRMGAVKQKVGKIITNYSMRGTQR